MPRHTQLDMRPRIVTSFANAATVQHAAAVTAQPTHAALRAAATVVIPVVAHIIEHIGAATRAIRVLAIVSAPRVFKPFAERRTDAPLPRHSVSYLSTTADRCSAHQSKHQLSLALAADASANMSASRTRLPRRSPILQCQRMKAHTTSHGLPLYASQQSLSDAYLTATAPPSRRTAHVARFITDSLNLGASAPAPHTFDCLASSACMLH
eukprot:2189760-Pleurochrysis_carterae.AAC.1